MRRGIPLTLRLSLITMALLGPSATGQLLGQKRPDFSGTWTTSTLPAGGRGGRQGSLGSGWGASFTIKQESRTLILEREFFSSGDLQPALKYRYSLDGSDSRNQVLMGRGIQESTSRASWEGDRLMIRTTYAYVDPENGRPQTGELRQTLWLEPARNLAWPPSLVVETTRVGVLGGPSSTTRTVYNRHL